MPDIKNLEEELRSIVAEVTEIEPEKITREAKFIEDLGMDSMMAFGRSEKERLPGGRVEMIGRSAPDHFFM